MKIVNHLFCVGIIFFVSCNGNSNETTIKTSTVDTPKPAENNIMIPNSVCYASENSKDTVFLQTEIFPNVVTGTLTYKIYEKDSNKGEIDGKMSGDTLLADYKFMSEGKTSTRQVIFLIKDSTATEGYGAMEEKEGKMIFKNRHAVDFSKGNKLKQIPCPLQ